MDKLSIRNYLVVAVAGMFCWLNANIVSAQTATDLNCSNCVGWFEFTPSVQGHLIAQVNSIDQNRSDVAALEARVVALEALVATLQAGIVPNLGTYLRIGTHNGQPAALFEAVNVMVVNGTGSTGGATNGVGNLIVGYDEFDGEPDDNKSGSHNLVVGDQHNYSSFGGLVAGRQNSVLAAGATVSGGQNNTASGHTSSVSGGARNTASGDWSSVSGGADDVASGIVASVSGGQNNTASGFVSSVSGGNSNAASGSWSSVSGGSANTAGGESSSVSGGGARVAAGVFDWVAGALLEER